MATRRSPWSMRSCRSLLVLEQSAQAGKRVAGRGCHFLFGRRRGFAGGIRVTRALVVVAVHCQLGQVGTGEFPRTTSADPGIHLQRPLAVTLVALLGIAPGLGDDAVELGVVDGWFGR